MQLQETKVRENIRVWTLGGDEVPSSFGANCTAVFGRGGVLLVDPLIAPAHARLVGEAVRRETDLPIRFVVLTHHHTDHALGSAWFAARGATVVAHRACREGMASEHPRLIEERRRDPGIAALFAGAESIPPAVTFEEGLALDPGDLEVRVLHPGHGHTPGDSVVLLPGERVAICGDLVSNSYHVNYEDADLANLEAGLQTLRSLGAETYIPGHGAPGGPEILERQGEYHAAVRAAAAEPETAVEKLRRQFPGYKLEWILQDTVRRWTSRR
jgi:cyclase